MPSRCWDPQDTLYLPVELLVKSKACPSFFGSLTGHLCRGPAGFKGQVLGFLPGTGGYKEAQQVPRMPAGCQDVFWVSGISARLWDVHRDWNDWDVRWGFPEVPAAQEYGDAGRCSQVPRCLSVPVPVPGCRGALVPPRGLSPPGASGLAGAEGDTGPWHPRAAAPLGAPGQSAAPPSAPLRSPSLASPSSICLFRCSTEAQGRCTFPAGKSWCLQERSFRAARVTENASRPSHREGWGFIFIIR